MAELNLSLAAPLAPSAPEWLAAVHANFNHFLQDHASAEKKASGMAMSVAAHYPDKPVLVRAMVDLAVEELTHYREVVRLILSRKLALAADQKDPYVHALNKLIRKGPDVYLLDRLLIGAIVERRGAERFGLIAASAEDPSLGEFYGALANSEARHWQQFIELALHHCAPEPFNQEDVWDRFNKLTEQEAELVQTLPYLGLLH